MTPRISIRVRLTAWYSAVLLLGLGVFALGMWFALEHRLVRGADARLVQRVDGLRTVLEIEGGVKDRAQLADELSEYCREIPEGGLIQVHDDSGPLVQPGAGRLVFPASPGSDAPSYRTVRQDGHDFRILMSRIHYGGQRYDVMVAARLDEVHKVSEDFGELLLFMVPAVLLSACLGGYWIARRALAPVDEITRVAKSIGVQNLSQRLPLPHTGDELERMSEAWNELLARLDASVKRIRQFTADASHELRTPIALVRATADLALRQQRSPEEYRLALRSIAEETERITALTESLLTLARADAGGLEMRLTPTDLNVVATEVVGQSLPAAQSKGVLLKAAGTPHPAVAKADPAGIRRLLLILVDNALRHTPRGGSVTVSAAVNDGTIVLAVEDTGEGIPAEAIPHIFERFFRADTVRSSGSGVGLGLSIAQAIAQAHGSRIAVESTPGAGARFFLALKSGDAGRSHAHTPIA